MKRVMLFIDADNVSGDVIEQAVGHALAEHGAVHVRRAHCTAEAAVTHARLFKRLAIRPIVNLTVGKNCTDIALAADAMEVVCAERPDVVVIVSSDSDFAPLVIRLREKGCRVYGIGQQGKTADESMSVYDGFVDMTHRKRTTPARRSSVPEPAPAPAPAPRAKRARKTAAPARPPLPEDVQRVLEAIPELRDGMPYELRHAAERLRQAGLLAKSAPSTRLFKKHAEHFVLTPPTQPNSVVFSG